MPLAPTVATLARQTIRVAFEELERAISPTDSQKFANTTLQDVRKSALQLEEQLATRRVLRNMRRLEPFFKGLEHYSKAVDVLCNGTPYLAWIWAPITLVLTIASEYVEAFEKIINAYSKIAGSLQRFEILNGAFIGDKDFQQILAIFYADILAFHQHAYVFITRNGWKLLFLTSWGRFQRRFDHILDDMKRHEKLIDKEANVRNISEARKMRQEVRDWREQNLEQIKRLEIEDAGKQYHSIVSWLKVDESDQQTTYDTLLSEGQKHPGTCDWVLKNKKMRSFLQRKPTTQVLWLQGAPGSGKSVLSAELISFARTAGYYTIYFLCRHSPASITYEHILKSLFLQLVRKDSELIAHVYRESVLGKPPPSIVALERLLHIIITSTSRSLRSDDYIWAVIDGLNECNAKTQTDVINLVNLITSSHITSSGTTCKVFISSRASENLSKCLRKKETLSLTEEKSSLSQAIKHYTAQRLQTMDAKFGQLNLTGQEIEDIERSITRKSDGMFLYARLVLDYLSSNIFFSGTEILTSVNELPEKISEFYGQILSQILAHLDARSVDRVKCMFRWIAFAKRPLRRFEFLSAMAFSSGDHSITTIAPRYILDVCNALVEEWKDTTLSFIHNSVQEYLQSPASPLPIIEIQAVEEQGIAMITCLLSGLQTFTQPPYARARNVQVAKGLHALHIYSTEYWVDCLCRYVELAKLRCSTSPLLELANHLSQRLDSLITPTHEGGTNTKTATLDPRLETLGAYPMIQKQARISMYTRSTKHLEGRLTHATQPNQLVQVIGTNEISYKPTEQGLEALLSSYQTTIVFLLNQEEYPEVSAQELEEFKLHFRTSAYTCRVSSCPHATLGFESKNACLEHEAAHLRRWTCTVASCRYPPFISTKSLQAHMRTHHNNQPRQSERISLYSSRSTSRTTAPNRRYKRTSFLLQPFP
ncbi:hypothetical protein F5Y19DRAFT_48326 [Xylariaceae sp. FL1651]|nr:hypothetical protein F5Y19DRAFT_48326 [Xylariaceae sp. FL1651]